MVKNVKNNGTEVIGLVTPTPGLVAWPYSEPRDCPLQSQSQGCLDLWYPTLFVAWVNLAENYNWMPCGPIKVILCWHLIINSYVTPEIFKLMISNLA